MKLFSRVIIASLFVVLLAGGLFADSTLHKGKDFTVEIKGDKIIFTLSRDGVTKAAIPGHFNGWKPDAPEAQMVQKDGKFVLEVDLDKFVKAKPYEFKFHTNGDWDQGGNKSLNIAKKKGAWVFVVSPTDAVKPNTKSSSDIEFHGRTSGLMRMAKNDIQNSFIAGDGDWYFDQSFLDLDIAMKFKIGTKIVGNAVLNYNINQNNSTKNLILDKYSTRIFLDLFTVNLFYGERVVEFLNPTRGLDKFVRSLGNTVTFFKESGGEINRFGRDYLGMVFTMDILNGSLQAVVARDRANNNFNTVMALRYYNNMLLGKKLGIGASMVYEKYRDAQTRTIQSFMGMLDPNRAYTSYFTKYNEYQVGIDADFNLGNLAIFAEGKGVLYANDGVSGADTLMDTSIIAGVKFGSGSLKLEARGGMILRDPDYSSAEDMTLVVLKGGFKTKMMDWRLQAGMYMFETAETLMNAILLGKVETSFFDLFADVAYIGWDDYMSVDARAWIEWYLNSKFRILGGGRVVMHKDSTYSMSTYITPYVGIGYKAAKNFNFKLYFGLNPEYDVYREDKGYTIDSYVGARDTSLDANYRNKEKRMMKNMAVQLEVDASF